MLSTMLGTKSGVYRLDGGNLEPLGLTDQRISAIHAWPDQNGTTVLAGSYGNGLFRSADGGQHWTAVEAGLTAPAFRTITPDPLEAGAILAGTEPARLFRSYDGGQSWQELEGIPALAGSDDWYLPYSPRAGALRNTYAPPGGKRLLASVEVGGLLDSRDAGATWSYLPLLADPDLHHITGSPDDPDLLFAALGSAARKTERRAPDAPPLGGVARSRDAGRSWTKLHAAYTRATIIPPARPDLVLAGPAGRVGALGRIEASADGGDTWQPASTGIETPMEDMVEIFVAAADGMVWAICSGGRLFGAEPGIWTWRPLLSADASIEVEAVAFLPDA